MPVARAVTSELRRGHGEDGVPLDQDAAVGGRGAQTALGHHHPDCRTEHEQRAGSRTAVVVHRFSFCRAAPARTISARAASDPSDSLPDLARDRGPQVACGTVLVRFDRYGVGAMSSISKPSRDSR